VGFEPTISAGERPQTHTLDRAATGTGDFILRSLNFVTVVTKAHCSSIFPIQGFFSRIVNYQYAQKIQYPIIIRHCFQFSGIGSATAAAEYNFFSDPEAAHIVIQNMKCPITIFPWEAAHNYGRISYVSKTLCH
jgi:hypothetical protein